VDMELEQLDEARQQLEQLLQLGKRSSAAHYYLGIIYYHNGDTENALASFLAVNDGQEYPQAQEHIVRLYLDQQLYNEAISRIHHLLQNSKDSTQQERLYLLKARALEKQGKVGDAYQLLSQ